MVGEAIYIRPPEQKGLSACYKYMRKKEPKNWELAIRRAKIKYFQAVIADKLFEIELREVRAKEKSERLCRLWHERK